MMSCVSELVFDPFDLRRANTVIMIIFVMFAAVSENTRHPGHGRERKTHNNAVVKGRSIHQVRIDLTGENGMGYRRQAGLPP
ncbi:hypothetical protein CSA56_03585 [candidate division KSB3 bacterium]|uniref:Uncharacterized protein n=1 Tax=candidate division KSB3 bacterium TaxID=2044937 RepID=A0A2G6KIU9_9BACT|nr:MAG: hypothetical protein CSA56_03585 [candidate division KSB3 bacterium]